MHNSVVEINRKFPKEFVFAAFSLTLFGPIPQNGQTHSKNSPATAMNGFSVFDHFVELALLHLNIMLIIWVNTQQTHDLHWTPLRTSYDFQNAVCLLGITQVNMVNPVTLMSTKPTTMSTTKHVWPFSGYLKF